jgi:FkbM family methyltransferase
LGQGDGEWCINPEGIKADSIVYSFGVGCDISFDSALIDRFGAQVHAFDPTPVAFDWLRQQKLPDSFHFHPFGIASYDGVADFSLPRSHYVSFTMSTNVAVSQSARGEVFRLPTIMAKLGHKRVGLLKLDVEGAEYDVVADLVACADKIDQLLIEFHHRMFDAAGGLEKTRKALQMLQEAGFALFYRSPRGLEYSFVRHALEANGR